MEVVSELKHLVLSGGGLLGISYIGLFRYLEEHNAVSQIKTISGCSAGAMFSSFLAVGYKSDELENIVKKINFKEYLNINADSIINFITLKGLDPCKNLMSFIKKCIKDKTGDENITFSQIQEKYNINLKIGVTNLTTSRFELLGTNNMPNLPIHQAINASIAIPFIFEPVIINNDVYCDGALVDSLPIEYIVDFENKILIDNMKNTNTGYAKDTNTGYAKDTNTRDANNMTIFNTMGIYLTNCFNKITAENYKTLSLSHYLNIVGHSLKNETIYRIKHNENNKHYKIIVVEIPCDIMTFIKIDATHEDIDNIINIAYSTIKNDLDTKIDTKIETKIDTKIETKKHLID
jgi:predicted acylesterase/phospholipase RssA